MFENNRISVLIPAFNEEGAIAKVLRELPSGLADEVVVIDNGSTDNTAEVARLEGARVIREEVKGYGRACLTGIASLASSDIIVVLDADHSDYPEQITRLLKPICSGEADLVLGSRVKGVKEAGAIAPQAYWGNKLAVFLIRALFGFNYSDMGPFRAIRAKDLKELDMRDNDFGWNAEMQIKAIKKGLKIKEVPVDYRKRIGSSKISGTLAGTFKAGSKIIYTIFKEFVVGRQ